MSSLITVIYLVHLFFLCSSCYLFIDLVLSFEICFLYPCGPLKYVSSFIQQLFLCTDDMSVTMLGTENMKIKHMVLQSPRISVFIRDMELKVSYNI